jgi:tetratricopeptide (TPR) repeat protein
MNTAPRIKFLMVCLSFVLSSRIFAAESNPVSSSPSTNVAEANTLNAYLQIQEQLHETQLAIASNRQETAAALEQNADAMTARIQLLEQTIAGQRASDVEAARKTQQMTLALAGIGMLGLAVMLLIVYFQLRTATRLVELAVSSPALNFSNGRAMPVVEAVGELPASARAVIEFTNAKLLGAVERLEKRILEMEQITRAPLNETASATAQEQNVAHTISNNGNQRVADLMNEGQLFLDANEPEKALKNFDEVLAIEPKHVEALVKKGSVLEKLDRVDEAVACYDRAIEADASTTIAYLHKGGLFNRMARYDEALSCYEKALKNSAREKVAA